MGDRYLIKCPVCRRENYFGNWTNYTQQCVCGACLVVHRGVVVISKEEMERIRNE